MCPATTAIYLHNKWNPASDSLDENVKFTISSTLVEVLLKWCCWLKTMPERRARNTHTHACTAYTHIHNSVKSTLLIL